MFAIHRYRIQYYMYRAHVRSQNQRAWRVFCDCLLFYPRSASLKFGFRKPRLQAWGSCDIISHTGCHWVTKTTWVHPSTNLDLRSSLVWFPGDVALNQSFWRLLFPEHVAIMGSCIGWSFVPNMWAWPMFWIWHSSARRTVRTGPGDRHLSS